MARGAWKLCEGFHSCPEKPKGQAKVFHAVVVYVVPRTLLDMTPIRGEG